MDWMDGRMDGWMNRCTDAWISWSDGWMVFMQATLVATRRCNLSFVLCYFRDLFPLTFLLRCTALQDNSKMTLVGIESVIISGPHLLTDSTDV